MASQLNADNVMIREVYRYNLQAEIEIIRKVVEQYNYVAMDTEFPGVVIKISNQHNNLYDFFYETMKLNVNKLKLIQIGFTFSNERGELPKCGTDKYCVWQFNFCDFNPDVDVYNDSSYTLLIKSGIDFKDNMMRGVSIQEFAEKLMTSGVVLDEDVTWLTFHGNSDFGYLLKALMGKPLPDTLGEFFKYAKIFFPRVYDIKHMTSSIFPYCGLKQIASELRVQRIGPSHQAGSDSLLTSCVFFRLKESRFAQQFPYDAVNYFPDLGKYDSFQ